MLTNMLVSMFVDREDAATGDQLEDQR
jgi:hypothetical protein